MTKTILVVTAMPEEMAFLGDQFTYHKEQQINHLTYRHTSFADNQVISTVCGIGKVNAAICTSLAYAQYRPDVIVNIGASGGLQPRIQVGDVVLANEFKHHDANATQFGYQHGQIPRMPVAYHSHQGYQQILLEKVDQFDFEIYSGLVCSGDSFVSDANFVIELKNKFPEILALDMESCAIAQTCHQLQIPFICIRGISDSASEGADRSYKECLELAMTNANKLFMILLDEMAHHENVIS